MKNYYRKKLSVLENPNNHPELSTPIGRFIDRASYLDLFAFSGLFIVSVAVYFTEASIGNGLSDGSVSLTVEFGDAMYFGIVTFTSLGYGDFSPQGFGKVVASFTAIVGLSLIALLIGKLASERSLAILNLLHRSDFERRLIDHIHVLAELTNRTSEDAETLNFANLANSSRDLAEFNEKIRSFTVFHSNQSTAMIYGNASSVSLLFKQLEKTQQSCVNIHKVANSNHDLLVSKRMITLAYQLEWLARLLTIQFENARRPKSFTARLTNHLILPKNSDSRLPLGRKAIRRMNSKLDGLEKWRMTQINLDVLEAVEKIAPKERISVWPNKYERVIAGQLGITNGMVRRHVSHLATHGILEV